MSSRAVVILLCAVGVFAEVPPAARRSPPIPVPPEVQAKIDAHNAREAANTAKDAASIANQVAKNSVMAAANAQAALKDAHDVIHAARIQSEGLSTDQQESLRKAEAKLRATMVTLPPTEVRVGDSATSDMRVVEHRVDRMKAKIAKTAASDNELASMQEELRQLHSQLDSSRAQAGGSGDKSADQMDEELTELQDMLKRLEYAELNRPSAPVGHDELKVEIEHLRAAIGRLQKYGEVSATLPDKVKEPPQKGEMRYRMAFKKQAPKVQLTPLAEIDMSTGSAAAQTPAAPAAAPVAAAPVAQGGAAAAAAPGQDIDIDTAMPYGELEPFGREDTAQELTESSIHESDEMVDQLERAEVAEEKRAVFRALTRLRGAAITSFDGVARSQTGNIDEYNKVHKWRNTHPLRHLADEESDVAKWAFPDDADF